MLSKELMPIMKKYINCPLCGSDRIVGNSGSLRVRTNFYSRTCKCGFIIVVKKNRNIQLIS